MRWICRSTAIDCLFVRRDIVNTPTHFYAGCSDLIVSVNGEDVSRLQFDAIPKRIEKAKRPVVIVSWGRADHVSGGRDMAL